MLFTQPPARMSPTTPQTIAVSVIAVCAFWRMILRRASAIIWSAVSATVAQRVHDLLARGRPRRIKAGNQSRAHCENKGLEGDSFGHDDLRGIAVRDSRRRRHGNADRRNHGRQQESRQHPQFSAEESQPSAFVHKSAKDIATLHAERHGSAYLAGALDHA